MKTKQIFAIGTLLISMLFFIACNPKEQTLNNLQEFTQNLEQNNQSFTEEQWKSNLTEYDEISKRLAAYESKYTLEEKETIGHLQGRCQAIFLKHALEDGIDDFYKELFHYKGLFDGIMDELLKK